MPLRALNLQYLPALPECLRIQRRLEKVFGEQNIEVSATPRGCIADITNRGRKIVGQAHFSRGILVASDLPYKLSPEDIKIVNMEPDVPWEWVNDTIKRKGQSCKLLDVHEHEFYNAEEPGTSSEDEGTFMHIHLEGCDFDDFVRVAQEYGY